MKKRTAMIGGCLLVMMGFALAPASQGAALFWQVDQIRQGMKGQALTVFHDTTIEKIDVEILKVLNSDYDQEKLILVKLGGKAIRKCGGLAAGMSGSPVYVKGKLVGALSYGFENADPFLAYVTPLQTMGKLLDKSHNIEYFTYYKRKFKAYPVATPVMISGMGQRGFSRLSKSLQDMGLQSVYLPDNAEQAQKKGRSVAFKPGSAIAVQLIAGDCRAAAIGTVTMVAGKHFLAFGHSFTNMGKVDFLAYQAQIYHVVKSPALPMKLGGSLYPVGRIYEDRYSGIAGQLDQYPAMIDVIVNIKDLERAQEFHNRFQVINHEQFYPKLVTEAATAAIDRAIDRVGSGTAKITFKLVNETEQPAFERENLVCSKDIAVSSLKELDTLIKAFASNEFSATHLKSIQINVQIDNRDQTARIKKLEVDRVKAKPGETINAKVAVHPFRGTCFSKSFMVKLPETLSPGKLILSVRGGSQKLSENPDAPKKWNIKLTEPQIDTYEQLLASFTDNPKNNELVLEVFEAGAPNNISVAQPVRLKLPTDYYLTGQIQQELEIEK